MPLPFRDEFRVTTVNDKRVGIEDLHRPEALVIDKMFEKMLTLNLKHFPEYVFTVTTDPDGILPLEVSLGKNLTFG